MSLDNSGGWFSSTQTRSNQLKPDQLKVMSPSVWNTTGSGRHTQSCPSITVGGDSVQLKPDQINSNQINSKWCLPRFETQPAREDTPDHVPHWGVTRFKSNQIKSTTILLSKCHLCVATPTITVVGNHSINSGMQTNHYSIYINICSNIFQGSCSSKSHGRKPYGEETLTTNLTGRQPLQQTRSCPSLRGDSVRIKALSPSVWNTTGTDTRSSYVPHWGWLGSNQSAVSLGLKHNRHRHTFQLCPSLEVTQFKSKCCLPQFKTQQARNEQHQNSRNEDFTKEKYSLYNLSNFSS
jgi:hypothetical protein